MAYGIYWNQNLGTVPSSSCTDVPGILYGFLQTRYKLASSKYLYFRNVSKKGTVSIIDKISLCVEELQVMKGLRWLKLYARKCFS